MISRGFGKLFKRRGEKEEKEGKGKNKRKRRGKERKKTKGRKKRYDGQKRESGSKTRGICRLFADSKGIYSGTTSDNII